MEKLKKGKVLLSSKQYEIIKERCGQLNEFIDASGSFIEGGEVTNGTEVTTNTMNKFGDLPQTGDDKAEEMGKDFNWNSISNLSQSFRRLTEDLNNEDVVVDKDVNFDLNDTQTLNSEPYKALSLYRSLSSFLSDLKNQQNNDFTPDINSICINAIMGVVGNNFSEETSELIKKTI